MIVAKNLKKEYINREKGLLKKGLSTKKAVDGVSLEIQKGRIIGLLGINGAGKTTTIKMLTTMIEPTEGTITLDNDDAVKNYMFAKKKINLITGGERNIYWRLTARENLEYFGSLYGIPRRELNNRIDQILKIVDLEEQQNVPVEKYSKGMKQRLQIARGLINDPEYIFLDEPTLGLDIMITKNIHNYIKKLAYVENKGILVTTHYIFEAEELCDYIYVINKGKIVAEGTPELIKDLYSPKKTYQFLLEGLDDNQKVKILKYRNSNTDIEIDEKEKKLTIKSIEFDLQEVISMLNEIKVTVINMDIKNPSLEDALFEIIEKGKKSHVC